MIIKIAVGIYLIGFLMVVIGSSFSKEISKYGMGIVMFCVIMAFINLIYCKIFHKHE